MTIWGSCSKSRLSFIQTLQNKAARAVTGNFDFNSSVSLIIKQLGWMSINKRLYYFIAVLVYKCINGQSPIHLSSRLNFVENRHDHKTRSVSNNLLSLPLSRNSFSYKIFCYNGTMIWNNIPYQIRYCSSLNCLKKCIKAKYTHSF